MTNYFIRYQAQPADESLSTKSWHLDIQEIAIRLENGEDPDYLFEVYESLGFHDGITAEDLFEKIRANTKNRNIKKLTAQYPLRGLCGLAWNTGDPESLNEAWEEYGFAFESKYVALYEGEFLCDVGDGVCFKPLRFIASRKTKQNS